MHRLMVTSGDRETELPSDLLDIKIYVTTPPPFSKLYFATLSQIFLRWLGFQVEKRTRALNAQFLL